MNSFDTCRDSPNAAAKLPKAMLFQSQTPRALVFAIRLKHPLLMAGPDKDFCDAGCRLVYKYEEVIRDDLL